MKPKELLTADYLDIIYDQRNKNYGGYELRKSYDSRLRKAAALALTGVAAMLSFSFISSHREDVPFVKPNEREIHVTNIEPPVKPIEPPKVQPPATAAAKPMKTTAFKDPVIVPEDLVKPDDQMANNKDLANSTPGLSNHTGDSVGIGPEIVKPGTGTGVIPSSTDKPGPPARWVEQMPQFIGDMNAFIGKHIQYPDVARNAGIEGRVAVEFVVNEDGSVSNARVVKSIGGGCDQEAIRIVNSMPKWKPGKNNGTPVKVYFVLPILFQLN